MNTLRFSPPVLTICWALSLAACGNEIGTTNAGTNNTSNTSRDAGANPPADAGIVSDSGTPSDSGTSNPDCEDVSGAWSPTGLNTCIAPGESCLLTQSGCAVDLDCDNGAFSVSGSASGGHIELTNGANRCSADVSGNQMSVDCSGPDIINNSCAGTFLRGSGSGPQGADGDADCRGAQECDLQCSTAGSCAHTCSNSAQCESSCVSGDCILDCSDGAQCDSTCSGGGCTMTCSGSADCDFSCSGGDCTFVCTTTGDCDTSCSGGGCVEG